MEHFSGVSIFVECGIKIKSQLREWQAGKCLAAAVISHSTVATKLDVVIRTTSDNLFSQEPQLSPIGVRCYIRSSPFVAPL